MHWQVCPFDKKLCNYHAFPDLSERSDAKKKAKGGRKSKLSIED